MGPTESDNFKQLITLTVITFSVFRCIKLAVIDESSLKVLQEVI
jgi:hypothetical protein